MKKLLLALSITLLLSSCTFHPSNSKLHNIQVIKLSKWDEDETIMKYYSFKDSCYHQCFIQNMFLDSFKIGSIRK